MADGAASMASATFQAQAAILSANAQVAQTNASIAGVWASHESRRLDYETQAAIAEQDRVKADLVRQTKALADIEDEARRANVPAGWLR